MFYYMFKAEFVTLVSLKVPSGTHSSALCVFVPILLSPSLTLSSWFLHFPVGSPSKETQIHLQEVGREGERERIRERGGRGEGGKRETNLSLVACDLTLSLLCREREREREREKERGKRSTVNPPQSPRRNRGRQGDRETEREKRGNCQKRDRRSLSLSVLLKHPQTKKREGKVMKASWK